MTLTIRYDAAGSGEWGALRTRKTGETYKHNGLDIAGRPGDTIVAPWGMYVKRISRPYSDDLSYSGIAWESDRMKGRIWYVVPRHNIIDTFIPSGTSIGLLQDVTQRYPDRGMSPHWHLQIDSIDPMVIIDMMEMLRRYQPCGG